MRLTHPLLDAVVRAEIERAASGHLGRRWASQGFTSLDDRASHPCGILHGTPFSVFAKLGPSAAAREEFTAELAGLRLIGRAGGVRVPVPVAGGLVGPEAGPLLLYEALTERPPAARERADWRSIGQVLAALHQAGHERFGLDGPRGFFGPLPQDNRPVPGNQWAAFFAERRLLPLLRTAADSGHLPPALAAGVEEITARLPGLAGPEPRPSLVHGDAQQNNFVSTADGAVVIDAAPTTATRRPTWPWSATSSRCRTTCSPPTRRSCPSTRDSPDAGNYGGCPPTSPSSRWRAAPPSAGPTWTAWPPPSASTASRPGSRPGPRRSP